MTGSDAEAPVEKPVRRRAPRRASAAAGAPDPVAAPAPAVEAAQSVAAEAAASVEAPAEAPKKRATRSRKKAADEAAPSEAAEVVAEAEETTDAPKKRASRSRKKVAEDAPSVVDASVEPAAEAGVAAPATTRTRRRASAPAGEAVNTEAAAEAPTDEAPAAPAEATSGERGEQSESAERTADAVKTESDTDKPARGRGRRNRSQKTEVSAENVESDAQPAEAKASEDKSNEKGGDEKKSQGDDKSGNRTGDSPRSSRTRQRDRKRRGQGDDLELEITEDDVLLPVAGILDILDNYAFVRTSGYLPGMSDVYVSLGQVKKYGMRRGDAVVGAIRQPRDNDGGSRQKYNAIVKVDSINGNPAAEDEKRADITEMTAVYPQERLRLAQSGATFASEIDRIAPIGLGQRALLTLPAKTPAVPVLAQLADAVSAAKPDAHLMVVLTSARPEDVTGLQRSVRGEVIASTFDRLAEDQSTIAELAIERARRLVELGHDVVVLLDSLNDLAQAYVQAHVGSRIATDAAQLQSIAQIKRLVAAARNLENAGSLTLIATARTGSKNPFDAELRHAITPAMGTVIRVGGGRFSPEVREASSYSLATDQLVDVVATPQAD